MTGPEHYRRAEQLLDAGRTSEDAETAANRIAQAQVHATLAFVAATAWAARQAFPGGPETNEWTRVTGG